MGDPNCRYSYSTNLHDGEKRIYCHTLRQGPKECDQKSYESCPLYEKELIDEINDSESLSYINNGRH